MAVASFVNARLVGRLGMRRVSHTALAGFMITFRCILVTASALGVASLLGLCALVAVSFFLFGLIAPNFNAIAMEPQGHNAGMASSVIGSLGTAIGALAGGIVGTVVRRHGFADRCRIRGCSMITCAIVFMGRRPRRPLRPQSRRLTTPN